jgi:hypothetical protein
MLWIKRNLFLAVGGLVALVLLGVGVYFFITAQQRNKSIEDALEQNKSELNRLQGQKPYPSPANITAAKKETERLRGAINQIHRFFTPVPAEKMTVVAFRSYRDNTLAELHRLAEQAKTTLPSRTYAFSFEAQRTKVEFKEGTFPAVPEQMAEVKALSKILFDAHVDPLVNIRRARVSKDDDDSSAASDYLLLKVETNAETRTVRSPYEITFGCLSSDLAQVLHAVGESPHGFIVEAVHVEPAAAAPAGAPGAVPVNPQPGNPQQPRLPRPTPAPNQPPTGRPALPPSGAPPAVARPGAGDRPIVLLKESRLKVTLLIYAIKAVK